MLLRSRLVVLAIAVCTSLGFAGVVTAEPPSWDAFKLADFSGIYLSPSLETDVLTYTLSLGEHPTMTYNSVTYDVKWVTAYFVVSQNDTKFFSATNDGTSPLDWKWEKNPDLPATLVAGWHDGDDTLNPGSSATLVFGSLNITDNAVLSGLHVSYNSTTGWFKGTLPPVPEPSSLAGLAIAAALSLPLLRRRKR